MKSHGFKIENVFPCGERMALSCWCVLKTNQITHLQQGLHFYYRLGSHNVSFYVQLFIDDLCKVQMALSSSLGKVIKILQIFYFFLANEVNGLDLFL